MKKSFYHCSSFLIYISSFLLIISVSSHAKKTEKVQFMAMELIPYALIDENGKETGVLYDILKEIIKTSRIGTTVQIQPVKRMVVSMKKIKKVCSIGANTPDVTSIFDFIEPVGYNITVGVLPAFGVDLNDYASLKDKLIAVPLGIIFDDKFHNDNSLSKAHPPNYLSAIKMLNLGRVDAVAGAIPTLKYIAKKQGMSADIFDKPLVFIELSMYLFCTTGISKDEREKLKKTVIELKNNGKTQKILDSYFDMSVK